MSAINVTYFSIKKFVKTHQSALTKLGALAHLMIIWCSTLYLLRSNSAPVSLGLEGLFWLIAWQASTYLVGLD